MTGCWKESDGEDVGCRMWRCNTDAFTHRHFYAETLLHTDALQTPLHACFSHPHTHTHFYTHAHTQPPFYTQTLLHTPCGSHLLRLPPLYGRDHHPLQHLPEPTADAKAAANSYLGPSGSTRGEHWPGRNRSCYLINVLLHSIQTSIGKNNCIRSV